MYILCSGRGDLMQGKVCLFVFMFHVRCHYDNPVHTKWTTKHQSNFIPQLPPWSSGVSFDIIKSSTDRSQNKHMKARPWRLFPRSRARGNRAVCRLRLKKKGFHAPLPGLVLANVRSLSNKLDELQLQGRTRAICILLLSALRKLGSTTIFLTRRGTCPAISSLKRAAMRQPPWKQKAKVSAFRCVTSDAAI